MASKRVDVAIGGGDWGNELLRDYAVAMRELDKLEISDQRSWKFLAAMHGFDTDRWRAARVIGASTVVPPSLTNDTLGDQCQHSTWYFVPWHRGYLFAFEAIIAAKVKELTGRDWVLPYWNYLDTSNPNARKIPEAFTVPTLWDGSPNPFVRYPRARNVLPPVPSHRDINLKAMAEPDFTVGPDGTLGFGGGKTGFEHFGSMAGELEANPHNIVHGMVGGFMGDAYFAGLDPIFWLHHCNIDRLWEAWMSAPGRTMTRDPDWMDKPTPPGRTFILPGATPGAADIKFVPRDTLRGGTLHRTYDSLTRGTGVSVGGTVVSRVSMGPSASQRVDLVGANADVVRVGNRPSATVVAMQPVLATAAVQSMGVATPGKETSRLYLALESIKGSAPYATVDVYINLPIDSQPEEHQANVAGSLHLFGLNRASKPDGAHGGNGLGQTLDITDLADRLHRTGEFNAATIRVTLVPVEGSTDAAPITVERISVLKRSGTVPTR